MSKKRLISGIQPTGRMHLGNYLGAIQNWVSLQDQFESFFMIADWHALTSVYENPALLRSDKYELALDLLSAGIDPAKACLFFQSDVFQHAELHLILSMMTPLPWLERVPTYKGKLEQMSDKDLHTYGFLGYPVLQAADILLYQGNVVPVGKDQLPHLELAREIIRRFNFIYKTSLPEPEDCLTHYPTLLGTDGRKMSKSYGNTIPLSDSAEDVEKKVRAMVTDPQRVRRTDPGNPDVCPVFSFHDIFNPTRVSDIRSGCTEASLGCVDCKKECAAMLNLALSGFREKRQIFAADKAQVDASLAQGSAKAKDVASDTMRIVRQAIGV